MVPLLLALACVDPAADKPATDRDTPVPDSADSGDTADTADTADSGDTAAAGPPILLVVLADDLGENFLWAMDTVMARLVPESVRFTRTYATVPLCCPVRASFLQGGFYVRDTGVFNNDGANGGITPFHDGDTLATRLQAHGYATALLGKYLNGYEDGGVAPYVPPGWDLFLVPTEIGDSTDTVVVRGSSTPTAAGLGAFEDTRGEHLTGWLFDEALAFLDAHPDEPVFVLLTPQSPHIYGTPAAEDLGTWDGYAPRPDAFAEADVSDKPGWIRRTEVDERDHDRWDAETRLMMENLASLDRGMGALLDGLDARGLTDRTTLVFTGDNGHLHGEHRLVGKAVAYEESVRVPLLVRAPGVAPREDARLVAMNLDVPATVAELAGLPVEGEGIGLGGALVDPDLPLRDHVFLETALGAWRVWAGVVTERWKYVEWGTGETELYDLAADPWELESLHDDPPEDADVAALAAWVDENRALSATTAQVPVGEVGEDYGTVLDAWGGVPPLTWTLDGGVLPAGLTLDPEGVVTGTPT
ncbi:MAG: sulfatase-like hydrolase/transferase, partial [Myxococcota bacterium]